MLGISMELGCFLAGVILSSMGHSVADEIRELIEPIRDFFAALFFGAIGNLYIFDSVLYLKPFYEPHESLVMYLIGFPSFKSHSRVTALGILDSTNSHFIAFSTLHEN